MRCEIWWRNNRYMLFFLLWRKILWFARSKWTFSFLVVLNINVIVPIMIMTILMCYFYFNTDIDPCSPSQCQNGAFCSPVTCTEYSCTCVGCYNGTNCQNGKLTFPSQSSFLHLFSVFKTSRCSNTFHETTVLRGESFPKMLNIINSCNAFHVFMVIHF